VSEFSPSEFSLSLRYKRPSAGSYPRVEVPGWYLLVGFANEGTANWFAEDSLLGAGEFRDIVHAAGRTLPADQASALSGAVERIARAGEDEARAQLERAESQLETLQATVARLREQVGPARA
jgi:hypothetical protein